MTLSQNLLYLEDSSTLEFVATVIEEVRLEDGRLGVVLDRSYFYPTGGGQEHDTGYLNEVRVIDVIKYDDPAQVVHVIDRPLPPGKVHGKIDADRRFRHMQHHTAQHLLTQCFVHLYRLDTLSANINGYSPSTLDLPAVGYAAADAGSAGDLLLQAENLANRFIYEDRPVHSYFVTPEELEQLPLRRAPKVNENIRIVEIDGFDYTPCGGTHCASTGQIGVIKIVKTEKQADRIRVHFVAGWQALELYQQSFDTVSQLAAALSVGQNELGETVLRQADALQKSQKELQALKVEQLAWEAERLADSADTIHNQPVVLKIFEDRLASDLRLLGTELAKRSGLVSVLVVVDGQKLSVVVACGEATERSARDLLAKLLEPFSGRGGGDNRLAQGGASISDPERVTNALRRVLESLL